MPRKDKPGAESPAWTSHSLVTHTPMGKEGVICTHGMFEVSWLSNFLPSSC